jgi:ubiquinone/menaquinone biosynthesis C-methylase UbiE
VSSDKIQEIFNDWAQTERSDQMAKGHAPIFNFMLRKLSFEPHHKVLDIGSGTGDCLNLVHQKSGIPQENLFGFDLSEKMIEKAQGILPGAHFEKADANNFPFNEIKFDHVLTIESIYYHPDPEQTVKKAFEKLNPGGHFFCALDYYKENTGSDTWEESMGVKMWNFSESQYKDFFESAGFETELGRIHNPNRDELLKKYEPSIYYPHKSNYENHLNAGTLFLIGSKAL